MTQPKQIREKTDKYYHCIHKIPKIVQGPVVRTPVGANPGLNFNLGFFIFLSKALSRIFPLFFLEYPIIKL